MITISKVGTHQDLAYSFLSSLGYSEEVIGGLGVSNISLISLCPQKTFDQYLEIMEVEKSYLMGLISLNGISGLVYFLQVWTNLSVKGGFKDLHSTLQEAKTEISVTDFTIVAM